MLVLIDCTLPLLCPAARLRASSSLLAVQACYVYDIGGPRFGQVIQKLEGHTDRVSCPPSLSPPPLILSSAHSAHSFISFPSCVRSSDMPCKAF